MPEAWSNHPTKEQNSSLVDWDLIADSQGNAVLVFSDAREGSDLDIHAYKIDPDGQFLWGPNGVTLSANDDFEPAPRAVEATDGDLVFVWSRLPDSGDGKITMQRLSPTGVPQLIPGGVPVAGDPGEDPGFQAIVPADQGNVIVTWVRDISTFQSPRHVRAQKFAPNGSAVWKAPVAVFDTTSVPIAHTPRLHPDGAGGALVLWHRSQANFFNALVQHLDAGGAELFPHNGMAVSNVVNRHHLDPTFAYREDTGESFVFWNERNANQSQWGILGQKLSATGDRAWGDAGIVLLPVDTIFKSAPRCTPYADGAMVFLADEPTGQFGQDRVLGMRVDAAGNQVWPQVPTLVSSHLSSKSRLPVAIGPTGVVTLAWEDDRSGTADVYGQNVNPDGTLGNSKSGVGETATSPAQAWQLAHNQPNPFRRTTEIRLAGAHLQLDGAALVIADVSGRIVRRIDLRVGEGNAQSLAWDGRTQGGVPLPAGTYIYYIASPTGRSEALKATLLR